MSGRGLLPSHDGKPRRKDITSDPGPLHMVIQKHCLWPKRTIIVQFLGTGSAEVNTIKDYVRECTMEWEKYANVKFEFLDGMTMEESQGDIQISFEENGGCKTGMNTVPRTMNLPPKELIDSRRAKAYILHEFGHALGCLHEHGSPEANISWNKERVYQHYCNGPKPQLSRQGVDTNVLRTYSTDAVLHSEFDPDSIMIYDIPATHVLENRSITWKGTLSETDKMFIGIMYP
ncbi:hypothetical protein MMC14_008759 [Varicellaria rhodocarpa]|nr:hypothetical protein [Varicellaria rhodocarpa]